MPISIDTQKAAGALIRLALGLALAAALGALWQHGRSGLRLEVEARNPAGATWRAQTTARGLEPSDVRRLTPPAAASAHARWSGVMRVEQAGTWTLRVRGDGRARLRIDGRPLLETGAGGDEARAPLPAGLVPIELEWDVPAGLKQLRLRRAVDGGPFADLDPRTLFQRPQGGAALALHGLLALVYALLPWTSLAAAIVLGVGLAAGARGVAWGIASAAFGAWFRGWRGRAAVALLATLVVAWGVALRSEALIHSFWETHEWRWSEPWRPLLVSLKPDTMRWTAQDPTVGGDPLAYLYYGRHLRDFYEERVREPLFVYATHLGLLATNDNSVGVGLASAFFSALTVLGVFLVGRQAFSPGVGLLAALGFALDREVIALAIQGWRDDAFACGLVFFAWGALRFYERGRFSDALILGLAGGAAWLTRITSLTFLVPGLLVLAFVPRGPARARRGERLGVAVLLCVALMAPFILNCAVALGDPFYAINEYTSFFRERSGHQDARPLNVVEYLLAFRPFEMADKAFIGYTSHPFAAQWNFADWWPPLGPPLAAASIVGLFLFLFLPNGRLLLLLHASAMLPFVWAWDVPGGTPYRHTLHAYPFYLLAAAFTIDGLVRLLVLPTARDAMRALLTRRRVTQVAATGVALALLAPAGAWGLHYFRLAEAVRERPGPHYIAAGPRDLLFFGSGWHRPVHAWNWHSRFLAGNEGSVHVPLVAGRAWRLRLRLDPFAPEPLRVALAWNGAPLAILELTHDPGRTGEYVVDVPVERVLDGRNRLTFRAERVDPASALPQRPEAIPEHWRASLEFRYLVIERPSEPGPEPSS